MTSRPTISACLMVRNEARGIERCLTSLRAAGVDEIVLVDTGSGDGTQDIARPMVDIYAERPWQDFATNRNETLDMATGDFLFVIDGDEWLDEPEQFEHVRETIKPGVSAVQVNVLSLMPSGDPPSESQPYRIIRNDARLRYQSRIHNYFKLDDYLKRTGTTTAKADLWLHHDGYAGTMEERKAKYYPRIPLYVEEINDAVRAGSATLVGYYHIKLGQMLVLASEPAEAIYYLTKALALLRGGGLRQALILISKALALRLAEAGGRMQISDEHHHGFMEMAGRLAAFGDSEALQYAGGIYYASGDEEKAEQLLEQAMVARSPLPAPETMNAAAKPAHEPADIMAA